MVSLNAVAVISTLFLSLLFTTTSTAQTDFTFASGLGTPVDQPINGIQIGTDFLGNPDLLFQKGEINLTLGGLPNCHPYLDASPNFGGMGVYGTNCGGTDNIDKGETLTLTFTEPVNLRALKFFRDHNNVSVNDHMLLSIDGAPATSISLLAVQSDSAQTFSGSVFHFNNPINNPVAAGYYLAGFQAEPAATVIELGDCSGDVGCTLINKYGFTSSIANAPNVQGKVSVKAPLKALDTRPQCLDPATQQAHTELKLSSVFPSVISAANDVIIPAHLCGIPAMQTNGTYAPEIWMLNVDSSLSLSEELIIHELDDTPFAPYLCASGANDQNARFLHPVMTWIPKPGTSEIPIINTAGERSHIVRAVNIGCGSLRAGVGRFSFFPYHLHYVQGTNFISVIDQEMSQLGSSIDQASSCLASNGVRTSALNSLVKSMREGLIKGNYTNTVEKKLVSMLNQIESEPMRSGLINCFWDSTTDTTHSSNSNGEYQPRNFLGDIKAQVLHLQYMMDAMVLVREQTPQP